MMIRMMLVFRSIQAIHTMLTLKMKTSSAAHAAQPGAGLKDETLGQNFDCQFDPIPVTNT